MSELCNDLLDLVVWQAIKIKELEVEKESMGDELYRLQRQRNVDLSVLKGKPHSEVTKLKLFIEMFNALSGVERNDVDGQMLIKELINTRKFSIEEAETYLRKGMQYGQIFERKAGMYAKA